MTPVLETSTERRPVGITLSASPSSSGVDVLVMHHQHRLVQTLLRVGQFRTLEANWNSYGAAEPSERIIKVVEAFIPASDAALAPFLPVPHPVPVPNGGVKLTWQNGDRELELEFRPLPHGQMAIEFLRVSHGEPVNEGPASVTGLLEHLTWVIQG